MRISVTLLTRVLLGWLSLGWLSAFRHRSKMHQLYDSFLFVVQDSLETGDVYLLRPQHSTRQLVPQSNETLLSFGYHRANLTIMTKTELDKFNLLGPIKPIIPMNKACGNLCADERLRVVVEKARVIQGRKLLHNIRHMGRFINGPISLLQGTCMTVTTKKPFANMASRGMMVAYELDAQCRDKADADIYSRGIPALPNRFNFSPHHFLVNSEDVRILVLPSGKVAIVYTSNRLIAIRPQYYIGYTELTLNPATKALDINATFFLANNIGIDRDHRNDKNFIPEKRFGYKNWSPFLYNNSVHFIQCLNPLHITTLSDEERSRRNPKDYVMMDQVSFSPHVVDWWKLGELRGGSPAHLINDREYLTFFHSLIHLPDQGRGTYWMGALTFSAHPPFRLLRISSAPLVDDELYQGPWMRQRFDYVYYPVAFLFVHRDTAKGGNESVYSNSYPSHIEDKNCSSGLDAQGVQLLMSFGRQDDNTFLTDINLCDLDASLVDVGPRDTKGSKS